MVGLCLVKGAWAAEQGLTAFLYYLGTLLLQNPVGQNALNYQGLYHEVARLFGLRSRRFRLYLDASMSGGKRSLRMLAKD